MQVTEQEQNQQQLGSDSFAHVCPCAPSANETCCATATTVCHSTVQRKLASLHAALCHCTIHQKPF